MKNITIRYLKDLTELRHLEWITVKFNGQNGYQSLVENLLFTLYEKIEEKTIHPVLEISKTDGSLKEIIGFFKRNKKVDELFSLVKKFTLKPNFSSFEEEVTQTLLKQLK